RRRTAAHRRGDVPSRRAAHQERVRQPRHACRDVRPPERRIPRRRAGRRHRRSGPPASTAPGRPGPARPRRRPGPAPRQGTPDRPAHPTPCRRATPAGRTGVQEVLRITSLGARLSRKAPMRRIALVTLVVDDYDEAIRHYTEALGFRLVEDTPRPDG